LGSRYNACEERQLNLNAEPEVTAASVLEHGILAKYLTYLFFTVAPISGELGGETPSLYAVVLGYEYAGNRDVIALGEG
jgi:hypothetical protein